jgi:hypothetical protein
MPVSYLSGGKIGDFIQQLSVVYEKYLETHDKAIIYISDKGDTFRFGVEKAYKDLFPIIQRQPYIEKFMIHNDEHTDIDLTSWRNYNGPYIDRMLDEYSIHWGAHPWVHDVPTDNKWSGNVVVSTTHYRFPDHIDWENIMSQYGKEHFIFVSFEKEHYEHFTKNGFEISYYQPGSMEEFYTILNSCRLFIGSLSMPLSIALSLHTPSVIGFVGSKRNYMDYQIFKDIKRNMRKAYLLTINRTSERACFCKKLLREIGFETMVVEATPHKDTVVSNKMSMMKIYEEIASSSTDTDWSYVFEDDINTLEPTDITEIIRYEAISDTFFYLGCCGPREVVETEHTINNNIVYRIDKGHVRGLHAVAFTKNGAHEFLEFIKNEENHDETYLDVILKRFSQYIHPNIVRYDLESYIGGHRGLFFQDRNAFPSSISN